MAILVADCGGTIIKLGLVREGAVVARVALEARSSDGLGPRLKELREVFAGLCRDHAVRPDAVALALPQLIPPGGRPVVVNGKYPDTPGLDLAGWAQECWQVPLTLINDAQAAVLGEWRAGAGRGADDVVMITLGTGIGGGVVLGGRLLAGRRGAAGLFGFLVAQVDAALWRSTEDLASAAALPQAAREDPAFAASVLAYAPRLDLAAIFHSAAAGDGLALRLRERALAVWSGVAVDAIHAYDPQVVVLGGGVMASAGVILPRVREEVARHTLGGLAGRRIEQAELGDDAALVGAAWAAGRRP